MQIPRKTNVFFLILSFIYFLNNCSATQNFPDCTGDCSGLQLEEKNYDEHVTRIKNMRIAFVELDSGDYSLAPKIPSFIERWKSSGVNIDFFYISEFNRKDPETKKTNEIIAVNSWKEISINKYDLVISRKGKRKGTDPELFEKSNSFYNWITFLSLGLIPLHFYDEGWLQTYSIVTSRKNSKSNFNFAYHVYNKYGLLPWMYSLLFGKKQNKDLFEIIWISRKDVDVATILEKEGNILLVELSKLAEK